MSQFLCPCCLEPLLIHISHHREVGFCMKCHQKMPLLKNYGLGESNLMSRRPATKPPIQRKPLFTS